MTTIAQPPLSLLLVEDNPGDARMIQMMLNEVDSADFDLEQVERLDAGLERLAQANIDFVLLDLSLPDSHGLETFLTAHAHAPEIPVIVLTGDDDDQLALQAVHEGAQDYLVKGQIDGQLLVRAIRYALERHRIERELRISELRYRTFFEQSQDAIYISKKGGRVVDANNSMLQMFGYSRAEIAGIDASELWVDQDQRLEFETAIERRGSLVEFPVQLRKKDGTPIDCLQTSTVRRNFANEVIGYQGIIRDVSEKKDLERRLLQSQKMEAVGQLAGGVAHDFNNLLTGITGYVSLALQNIDPEESVAADLRKVLEVADRAGHLTAQLLAFSRGQPLQEKVINLNQRVADSMKMLQRLVAEDIRMVFLPGANLPNVLADPVQAEQVVLNLVINARDAMPEGGELTIETTLRVLEHGEKGSLMELSPGSYVVLRVSDTGIGMDENTQQHAFEPFFTTKGVRRGTGLGLATVYGIVEQHHGAITMSSEVGEGTTVEVFLPAVDAEIDTIATDVTAQAAAKGCERILLVEDNEVVRAVCTRGLRLEGYEVLVAGTPGEALELAQAHGDSIELLITDVVMPETDGPSLYEQVLGPIPGVKVLYMSGYADRDVLKKRVLEVGAPFLPKPFSLAELTRHVRRILDEV